MYASDISSELCLLGFDLFRDKAKATAKFIQADISDTAFAVATLECAHRHHYRFPVPSSLLSGTADRDNFPDPVPPTCPGTSSRNETSRQWGQMYFHSAETFGARSRVRQEVDGK